MSNRCFAAVYWSGTVVMAERQQTTRDKKRKSVPCAKVKVFAQAFFTYFLERKIAKNFCAKLRSVLFAKEKVFGQAFFTYFLERK